MIGECREAVRALGILGERWIGSFEEWEREPRLLARVVVASDGRVLLGELFVQPAVRCIPPRGRADRVLEERDRFRRSAEGTEGLSDRVARYLDRCGMFRLTLARVQRLLESVERGLQLAGLVVLPAEVVEEWPEPVRGGLAFLSQLDPPFRPGDQAVAIGSCERGHVRCVRGDEVLPRSERSREGRLEVWQRRATLVPARAPPSTALELDSSERNLTVTRKGDRLVDRGVAGCKFSPKSRDAGELRENLSAPLVGALLGELALQSRLGRVEVVEIPQRSQPVVHIRSVEGRRGRTRYPRVVELDARPPLDPALARALATLLEDVSPWPPTQARPTDAWRTAGLAEAVEGDDEAVVYARSPRSTRGATRA